MEKKIDEVSLQIGSLTAKVDNLQSDMHDMRNDLRNVAAKLDEQIQNGKETKARMLGIGAGVGLAGGGSVVAIKEIISNVFGT